MSSSLLARPVPRRSLGLMAASVLLMTACGPKDAQFADQSDSAGAASDAGGETAASAPTAHLESGYTTEKFDQSIPVAKTIRPNKNTVTTPTGTLTIAEVLVVQSVGRDQVTPAPSGSDQASFAPAAGETLRIVKMSFDTSNAESEGFPSQDALPATDLTIDRKGTRTHLATLNERTELSYLLSVPENGSTTLVVSCDGHDQIVNVLDGERQEDEVAAAYYRPNRRQEPHQTLNTAAQSFKGKDLGDDNIDITATASFQIASAELTPWAPGKGWAPRGSSWLAVAWSYEFDVQSSDRQLDIKEFTAALESDPSTGDAPESVHKENTTPRKSGDAFSIVQVPADMQEAKLKLTGKVVPRIMGGYDPEIIGGGNATFTTQPFAAKFPLK